MDRESGLSKTKKVLKIVENVLQWHTFQINEI